jgi:hypothetical protein
MYHKDGGAGVSLIAVGRGGTNGSPAWPSVSGDEKRLYYQMTMDVDSREPLSNSLQLRRFTLRDGQIVDVTAGERSGAAAGRFSRGGGAAPEISPDGRWLSLARQIHDGTLEFTGHRFGPRTALWLRDMKRAANAC